eukprot:6014052-Prymnesium_polylepis.3
MGSSSGVVGAAAAPEAMRMRELRGAAGAGATAPLSALRFARGGLSRRGLRAALPSPGAGRHASRVL